MPRLLKTLFLALAVVAAAAMCMVAASCGSTGTSYRVINAIAHAPNNSDFDITMNGATVFMNLEFTNIQPAGNDAYQSVSSGSDTMGVFEHGTTTSPYISSPLNLAGSTQYTVVLMGQFPSGTDALAAQPFTDDNTAPTSGSFEFRIIHASPSLPTPVDIYIVPPGTPLSQVTPQISGLPYGQPGNPTYLSLAPPSSSYNLIVTVHNSKTPFFGSFAPSYAPSAGQIRTLVLVDAPGGGPSPTPLEFDDLE